MKRLFETADRYIRTMDWKQVAVLKFCLIAMGMLIGMVIPETARRTVGIVCAAVFILTYIPLMARFIGAFRQK